MLHHLRAHLPDASGLASSLGLLMVGIVEKSSAMQYVGAVCALGMFGLGLSREVREWVKMRPPKP